MDNTLKIESTVEEKRYIVVTINVEQYGIDIGYVDNIVRMQKITRVPKSQDYFYGVINLRGEIIPVMSLRKRFGLEIDEFTDKTRIIILKPEKQDPIGIIVDMVKEVETLGGDSIDKVPTDGKDDITKYICGVGKSNRGLISILHINNVINDNQQ